MSDAFQSVTWDQLKWEGGGERGFTASSTAQRMLMQEKYIIEAQN